MISDKNTRIPITISKELKKEAEQIAKAENRTLNNLVITALIEYIKNKTKNKNSL